VLAKRLRVDGLLVNVRLDQSIFLLLDAMSAASASRRLASAPASYMNVFPEENDGKI